jgi:serine/threonine-protein kinase HipA
MINYEKIAVSLLFDTEKIPVGNLVEKDGQIYFKYDPSFLSRGLPISPWKLALKSDIFTGDPLIFNGLFGVFQDSLPDGWGQLLLDRSLAANGILPQEVGVLDRLAYIGSNGPGALIYEPVHVPFYKGERAISLDAISEESQAIYEGTHQAVVERLFQLGGSSGGARPKILVGLDPKTNHLLPDSNSLPEPYEHWIIKFSASTDFPDMAEVEYAYYLMALEAGLDMAPSKLLQGESGKNYFATKRFDRVGNQRLHLHSIGGLLHDDYRRSTLDYGHLMDAAFTLEHHVEAYQKILRLATFNLFLHNRDDHSKNFSFLMDKYGRWNFAPVYDLTFSYSSHGFHSTSIGGESKSPGVRHLNELAKVFDIPKVEEHVNAVRSVAKNWASFAEKAGVSEETMTLIQKKLRVVDKQAT